MWLSPCTGSTACGPSSGAPAPPSCATFSTDITLRSMSGRRENSSAIVRLHPPRHSLALSRWYTHTHTHLHTHSLSHVHTCVWVRVWVCVSQCSCICETSLKSCVCVCVCMYLYMYVYVYVPREDLQGCPPSYLYMYMYVCVCMHPCMYVWIQGGLAGLSGWLLIYPLDSIKTRIQVMLITHIHTQHTHTHTHTHKPSHTSTHTPTRMYTHSHPPTSSRNQQRSQDWRSYRPRETCLPLVVSSPSPAALASRSFARSRWTWWRFSFTSWSWLRGCISRDREEEEEEEEDEAEEESLPPVTKRRTENPGIDTNIDMHHEHFWCWNRALRVCPHGWMRHSSCRVVLSLSLARESPLSIYINISASLYRPLSISPSLFDRETLF